MKPNSLPKHRVSQAEVSLRLAFYLLDLPGSDGVARVGIDGAQVRVGRRLVAPIVDPLSGMPHPLGTVHLAAFD